METLCWTILLSCLCAGAQKHREDPSSPGHGITHNDIKEAILALQKSVISLGDKLQRHELRSTSADEQILRQAKKLEGSRSDLDHNVDSVGDSLVRMETRMQKTEETIEQMREEQRSSNQRFDAILKNLLKLVADRGQPGALPQELFSYADRKAESLRDEMLRSFGRLSGELEHTAERVARQGTRLEELLNASAGASADVLHGLHTLEPLLSRVSSGMAQWLSRMNFSLWYSHNGGLTVEEYSHGASSHEELSKFMEKQDALASELIHRQDAILQRLVAMSEVATADGGGGDDLQLPTVRRDLLASLNASEKETQSQLAKLYVEWAFQREELLSRLTGVDESLKDIQETTGSKLDELSRELRGLSNVESVVLETADSVLSTKRRVEYGIQQILLEIGDAVRVTANDLNSTILGGINSVARDILAKQSNSMLNMTFSLGSNIEQIWRQIGVMYLQLTQSRDLLANVENQTKVYVNSSLNTVGHMGGQVGEVLDRMAQVEDNLNFLLGRLSLVASEFNVMKSTVGEELGAMREKIAGAQSTFASGTAEKPAAGSAGEEHQSAPKRKGPFPIGSTR